MAVGKETEKGAGDEGRRSALALYEDIEAEHMAALEATGIAFAPYDSERLEREGLLRQLRERGARIRNGGASVAIGPIRRILPTGASDLFHGVASWTIWLQSPAPRPALRLLAVSLF